MSLHKAIRAGDAAMVRKLLSGSSVAKRDLEALNEDGNTPLMNAIVEKRAEIVEILVKDGRCDVNALSADGEWHALGLAVLHNDADVLKALLAAYPRLDLGKSTSDGYTSLSIAALNGSLASISLLLSGAFTLTDLNKSAPTDTPLSLACQKPESIEVVRVLLADPRVKPAEVGSSGANALFWAARNNNIEAVRLLLADKRVTKDNVGEIYYVGEPFPNWYRGFTAMHGAALCGSVEVLDCLVKHAKTRHLLEAEAFEIADSLKPLHVALEVDHEDAALFLLKSGAECRKPNRTGVGRATPLYKAAANLHYRVLKVLIAKGVDCNAKAANSGDLAYDKALMNQKSWKQNAVLLLLAQHTKCQNVRKGANIVIGAVRFLLDFLQLLAFVFISHIVWPRSFVDLREWSRYVVLDISTSLPLDFPVGIWQYTALGMVYVLLFGAWIAFLRRCHTRPATCWTDTGYPGRLLRAFDLFGAVVVTLLFMPMLMALLRIYDCSVNDMLGYLQWNVTVSGVSTQCFGTIPHIAMSALAPPAVLFLLWWAFRLSRTHGHYTGVVFEEEAPAGKGEQAVYERNVWARCVDWSSDRSTLTLPQWHIFTASLWRPFKYTMMDMLVRVLFVTVSVFMRTDELALVQAILFLVFALVLLANHLWFPFVYVNRTVNIVLGGTRWALVVSHVIAVYTQLVNAPRASTQLSVSAADASIVLTGPFDVIAWISMLGAAFAFGMVVSGACLCRRVDPVTLVTETEPPRKKKRKALVVKKYEVNSTKQVFSGSNEDLGELLSYLGFSSQQELVQALMYGTVSDEAIADAKRRLAERKAQEATNARMRAQDTSYAPEPTDVRMTNLEAATSLPRTQQRQRADESSYPKV